MAVTYAGINLLTHTQQIADYIAERISLEQVLHSPVLTWSGPRRESWPWRELQQHRRPVKPGTVFWPNDAMRFSVAHFLCTDNRLAKILAKTGQGLIPQPLVLSNTQDQGTTAFEEMYLLPPRPLAQIPNLKNSLRKLYLLTCVDHRFFWWEKAADIPVDAGTTTWADMFDDVAAALGVTLNPTTNAVYLKPGAELTSHFEFLPQLLDALCANTGQRLIANLDGTYDLQTTEDAQAIHDDELTSWRKQGGGQYEIDEAPQTPVQPFPRAAANVLLTFPKVSEDTPTGEVWTETATTGAPGDGVKLYHDSAVANFTLDTDPTPSNQAELTALAEQIASDYYGFSLGRQSVNYAGIVPYEPEGLSDWIEWTVTKERCGTRVERGGWLDLQHQLNHWGSAGGQDGLIVTDKTTYVTGTITIIFDPADFGVTKVSNGVSQVTFTGASSFNLTVADNSTSISNVTNIVIDNAPTPTGLYVVGTTPNAHIGLTFVSDTTSGTVSRDAVTPQTMGRGDKYFNGDIGFQRGAVGITAGHISVVLRSESDGELSLKNLIGGTDNGYTTFNVGELYVHNESGLTGFTAAFDWSDGVLLTDQVVVTSGGLYASGTRVYGFTVKTTTDDGSSGDFRNSGFTFSDDYLLLWTDSADGTIAHGARYAVRDVFGVVQKGALYVTDAGGNFYAGGLLISAGSGYTAGRGLTGSTTFDLSLITIHSVTASSYTVLSSDDTKALLFNNASGISVTVPQATGSFTAPFFFWARNEGTGDVVLTPTTSTINGASSLTLTKGRNALVISDGTNYRALTENLATTSLFGLVKPDGTTVTVSGGVISAVSTAVAWKYLAFNISVQVDASTGSTQNTVCVRTSTASSTTLTLWDIVSPVPVGNIVVVKNEAGAGACLVAPHGTDTIEGSVSAYTMGGNGSAVMFVSDLVSNWTAIVLNDTSTLSVSGGGTGQTTLTAHAVLLGNGASGIAFATIGTAGRLLIDQGAGADPSFNAVSGDFTITAGGVATIKTDVALAGNPTTTTQSAGDNSTKIATTAFVTAAVANVSQILDQQFAHLSSNYTNSSNPAALTNVTGLSFSIGANQTWLVEFWLHHTSTAGGMKLAVTIPTGASIIMDGIAVTTAVTAFTELTVSASGTATAIFGNGASGGVYFAGIVKSGATTGTVQLQASNVTNAQTITISAPSTMRATRTV